MLRIHESIKNIYHEKELSKHFEADFFKIMKRKIKEKNKYYDLWIYRMENKKNKKKVVLTP